jgi:hypothetical protein
MISGDIVTDVSDVLIRDIRDDVLAGLDALAARMGLSPALTGQKTETLAPGRAPA